MIKKILIVAILIGLLSCDRKTNKEELPTQNNISEKDSRSKPAGIKEINKSIYGTWINLDYIENLDKLKSPYAVSLVAPYELIKISEDNFSNDTLKISWDNQFLSEFPGFNCYKISSDSEYQYIGYTDANETPDLTKHYTDSIPVLHSLKLIDGFLTILNSKNDPIKRYTLLTKNTKDEEYQVLQEKVNKQIQGKYQDIHNPETSISFLPQGKITGIKEFDSYDVNFFFWQDYGMYENDFIELRIKEERYDADHLDNKFIFKFSADTLLLYSIYDDTIQTETYFKPTIGELKLKLIKN